MAFTENTTRETISVLKHHINALQEENSELQGISKSLTNYLHDHVKDLVNKGDCHACLELEGNTTANSEEQDCLYHSYKQLLRWIPSLKLDLAVDSEDYEVKLIMKDLNTAADSAHGDDTTGLKMAVIDWLMHSKPTPEPVLESHQKEGHGFYHNTTSQLICPVEYDWSNAQHRANICGFDADYIVTADSWPYFLYKNKQYDPNTDSENVVNNADQEEGTSIEPLLKHQKGLSENHTQAHVAALLGMKSIKPHAIAYTAVQLHFALSSCNAWCLVHEDFNYVKFYKNILLFFKDTCTMQEKDEISDLLYWWNHSVFGHSNASVYHPQPVEKKSVASTLRKQCERLAARGKLSMV
ncbi:hypothetical protein V8B97DRAFT_2024710 [Scleroderma yunnanense]